MSNDIRVTANTYKISMFGFGNSTFLGVDFGTSAIKVVELSIKEGKPFLVNFAQVPLLKLDKGMRSHEGDYDEELGLYFRALVERMHPKTKAAYVAMPAFTGLIALTEFPQMEEGELQAAIQFEAHKYIPSSLDEVALSWEVVGTRTAEDGLVKMEILLVAALNKEVQRYEKFVKDANLRLSFLELETFSLVRSIVGKQPGLHMLMDIGARATNLVLVEDGVVKVSRNLDMGGKDITRTLMENLSITQERAESLKKSGKDFLNSPESALAFPGLQMIGSEVERMLLAYQAKHPDGRCQGAILSGGTARFTGLDKYLAKLFQMPVTIGNPWKEIVYESEQKEVVDGLGASFSVAIGLAMNGVDSLLHPEVKKKDEVSLGHIFSSLFSR